MRRVCGRFLLDHVSRVAALPSSRPAVVIVSAREASSWFPFAQTVKESPDGNNTKTITPHAGNNNLPPTDFPESNFLKVIKKEIDDEEYRDDKIPPDVPAGWTIHHDEGTSFFTMQRTWRRIGSGKLKKVSVTPTDSEDATRGPQDDDIETHFIRSVIKQRDVSLDPELDLRGEHFPFNIIITTDFSDSCIDVTCDVVEGELRFDNVRSYESKLLGKDLSLAAAFDRGTMYPGPCLDETEEEVLDGLQAYMAERGFDDQFAEFVAQYTCWIEQMEYEKWLRDLKAYVEA